MSWVMVVKDLGRLLWGPTLCKWWLAQVHHPELWQSKWTCCSLEEANSPWVPCLTYQCSLLFPQETQPLVVQPWSWGETVANFNSVSWCYRCRFVVPFWHLWSAHTQCDNFADTSLTFLRESSWISEHNGIGTLRPLWPLFTAKGCVDCVGLIVCTYTILCLYVVYSALPD